MKNDNSALAQVDVENSRNNPHKIQPATKVFCCLIAFGAFVGGSLNAAVTPISVGPGGSGVMTFDTLPGLANGWSGKNPGGSHSTINTVSDMVTIVQTNVASAIATALLSTATVSPAPSANALPQWNSVNLNIQTRVTGDAYLMLMATLQNNTGGDVSTLNINYDLGAIVASDGSFISEEVPGHVVFYSLTGLPNSWTHIPALDSPSATFAGPMSASVALSSAWLAGSTMYVLWCDDDAIATGDAAGQAHEGCYTIDNIVFTTSSTPAAPAFVNNTDPVDRTVVAGSSTTFAAVASGVPAPTYLWYKTTDLANPVSTSTSYTINPVHMSDAGVYFVIASNSQGTATSRQATLTVTAPPPPVVFTNGTGLITFDTIPPVQQWSTRTWSGDHTNPADPASMDIAAKTNDATTINVALFSSSGTEAGANALGVWSSAGYIQTRPTGDSYAGIMATVSNASGGTLTAMGINYTLTIFNTNFLGEQVAGDLVYYSTSGTPGSWTQIPSLQDPVNDTNTGVYAKSATIDLSATPWFNGGLLYFLWVDDNANPGSPDTAVQIDNVQFITTIPAAPAFANNTDPTNRTVNACSSTTFTAGPASGFPTPTYQWYKTSLANPLNGQTGSSYTISSAQQSDAGVYFVVAHNSSGPDATSHQATLTVNAAPALNFVSAVAQTNGNILVSYSTQIDPTSPSLTQPTFQNTLIRLGPLAASDQTSITNALLRNGTNILLEVDTLNVDSTNANNYAVTLSGVHGTCGQIADQNQHGVSSAQVYLVRIDASWQHNQSGVDPGPTWLDRNYNDTASPWLSGRGIFDFKTNGPRATLNGNVNNTLLQMYNGSTYLQWVAAIPTYEFRTHFIFPGDPTVAGTVLLVRPDIDDACSFFINGQQAGTIGFTNPPVGPSVWAEYGSNYQCRTVGNANFETNNTYGTFGGGYMILPLTNVVRGDNVLAVELKQERPDSSDIDMGLELVATVPTVAPFLISSRVGNQLTLTWNQGQLQSSSLLGPGSSWTPVSGGAATSPFQVTIPSSGTGKLFFRLQN